MTRRWTLLKVVLIVLFLSFSLYQKGLTEERYTVKPGDTLYEISKSFGVDIEALKKANHSKTDAIKPKQVLLIPIQKEKQTSDQAKRSSVQRTKKLPLEMVKRASPEMESYVVQRGDSLYSISKKLGLSIEKIKKVNGLQSTGLSIGQKLLLQKQRMEVDEEVEELGDTEEVTGVTQAEGERGEEVASNSLGKWNNTEERNLLVRVVRNFLGVPYRLGGSTLKGIDCSAFVKKIYEIFNVQLPRTAREQFLFGRKVEKNQLEKGDLVFFRTRRANNGHVGIYIGDNQFVHASSHDKEVKVDTLDAPYFNQRFLRGVRLKELERES
jgi:cell wall-associated NlpC family hydrolase